MTKAPGEFIDIQHVGSAHTDAGLALLLHAARELLHTGQGELDLGPVEKAAVSVADVADWTRSDGEVGLFPAQEPVGGPGRPPAVAAGGRVVVGTASLLLWGALAGAYARLGFDAVGDETLKALVLGRVVSRLFPPTFAREVTITLVLRRLCA